MADRTDQLLAAVARLEAKVDALARRAPSAPAASRTRRLVTVAAAARALGVDYKTTVHELIRDGRLRAVPVGDRLKVPVEEIERVVAEGTLPASRRARRRRDRRSSRAPLAADLARPLGRDEAAGRAREGGPADPAGGDP